MDFSNRKATDSRRENASTSFRKISLASDLQNPDLLPLYGQLVSNLTNQNSSLKKKIERLEQKNQRLASTVSELNKAEKAWTQTVLNRIAELKTENNGLKRKNQTLEEDMKRLTGGQEALQYTHQNHIVHLRKKLKSEHAQRDRMHEAVVAQLKSELEVERARTKEYRGTMKRFKKALEGQIWVFNLGAF